MSAIEVMGEIRLEPQDKMCFNAPFIDTKMQTCVITNMTSKRLGWRTKSSNAKRLMVDPPYGLLEPNQTRLVSITCEPFDAEKESLADDRITIEYREVSEWIACANSSKRVVLITLQNDLLEIRTTFKIEYLIAYSRKSDAICITTGFFNG
ncbi:MSP domain protein [Trichuris suis]|nr:MSP domain protein [Trichuris suis]